MLKVVGFVSCIKFTFGRAESDGRHLSVMRVFQKFTRSFERDFSELRPRDLALILNVPYLQVFWPCFPW